MNKYKNKKFVASYSGGKDSMLAIYRAIKSDMIPLELITTVNIEQKLSWFHSIPLPILNKISDSINIPIEIIKTTGEQYKNNFEKALLKSKEKGAEYCIFGDIDIEGHIKWCSDCCESAGIKAYFPLLNENREKLVYEFIDSGFKTFITVIDITKLPEKFLGLELTKETALKTKEYGADICGENGEYHTFVTSGPIFKKPFSYSFKDIVRFDKYAILPLK